MILSFDVDNDKFGEIALPYEQQQLLLEGLMVKPNCPTVFKGKLTFITLDYLRINHINEDKYTDCRELTRIPNLWEKKKERKKKGENTRQKQSHAQDNIYVVRQFTSIELQGFHYYQERIQVTATIFSLYQKTRQQHPL